MKPFVSATIFKILAVMILLVLYFLRIPIRNIDMYFLFKWIGAVNQMHPQGRKDNGKFFKLNSHYHGRWCPGDARSQSIRGHGIQSCLRNIDSRGKGLTHCVLMVPYGGWHRSGSISSESNFTKVHQLSITKIYLKISQGPMSYLVISFE